MQIFTEFTVASMPLKWKERSDDNLKIKYKNQVNKASKMVRLAKRDFERKIAKNIKKDSKTFFKYARSNAAFLSSRELVFTSSRPVKTRSIHVVSS